MNEIIAWVAVIGHCLIWFVYLILPLFVKKRSIRNNSHESQEEMFEVGCDEP